MRPVEPVQSTGRRMRIAGIALGGAGAAAVATAIIFYARANSLSDQVSTSDTPSASDYQSGKTAETMQWVFYGVGAASLAAGSILYYVGWKASAERSVSIAPVFGHGVAGLSARRAF